MRKEADEQPLMSEVVDSVRATALKAEAGLRQREGRHCAAFAEIAVEFQCRMSPHWNEGRKRTDMRLKIGRPRFPWLDRRVVHSVRIVCRRADAWEPHVYVNGKNGTSVTAVAGLTSSNKEGEIT
ncbi:hypothetical protein [Luteibacter sp. SG786]|uniref:hypothetical protein n=1 Tax=Luteibacter sp. SG786 TaxID=2587130 RepID=UPI00141FF6B9|nr:hypothetical protein [Luteibacter sp. SG786]NII56121.1 hypothetical protein [Luteibacter sp. SG786]